MLLLVLSLGLAQIPDSFTNLKVLPRIIARDSLIQIMRGFSLSLNVCCQCCLVGGDGSPSRASIRQGRRSRQT